MHPLVYLLYLLVCIAGPACIGTSSEHASHLVALHVQAVFGVILFVHGLRDRESKLSQHAYIGLQPAVEKGSYGGPSRLGGKHSSILEARFELVRFSIVEEVFLLLDPDDLFYYIRPRLVPLETLSQYELEVVNFHAAEQSLEQVKDGAEVVEATLFEGPRLLVDAAAGHFLEASHAPTVKVTALLEHGLEQLVVKQHRLSLFLSIDDLRDHAIVIKHGLLERLWGLFGQLLVCADETRSAAPALLVLQLSEMLSYFVHPFVALLDRHFDEMLQLFEVFFELGLVGGVCGAGHEG